jgi:IclR family acetate operon transcriptional repressor
VAILRAFSQERSKLALKDIVKATALDPGTSRRILVTLKEEGIVFQDPSNGLYSLSTGLRELGQAVVIELPLAQVLQEKLQSLAELTQTTVYLSAIRNGQVICLSRHNGGQPIEVRWWNVGEARPYNRGAGPRILFAHLPGSIQNTVLAEIVKVLS